MTKATWVWQVIMLLRASSLLLLLGHGAKSSPLIQCRTTMTVMQLKVLQYARSTATSIPLPHALLHLTST